MPSQPISASRVQTFLRQLLGLTGPQLSLEVAHEVYGCMDLFSVEPPDLMLAKAILPWMFRDSRPAGGAGNTNHFAIVNPVSSGRVVVVQTLQAVASTLFVGIMYPGVGVLPIAPTWTQPNLLTARDSRSSVNSGGTFTGSTQLLHLTDATAVYASQFVASLVSSVAVPTPPIILGPGAAVILDSTATNVADQVWGWGYERQLESREVKASS